MNEIASAPIRIAFCITELEPGGAERCLVELVTRLDRGRFEPTVYCLAPRPTGNPMLAERLGAAGIPVRYFGGRRIAQFPGVLARLRRQLLTDRPRLMQTFLFHANVLGAIAARRAGVPNVVAGIRVAEKRTNWHLRVARWADRYVDRHVCVSQSVREFSAGQGGLPAEKLVVIPNGVDLERFSMAQPRALESLGVRATRPMVFVGRIDAQKGLGWLMELLPQLFRQLADRRIASELIVVGDGPDRQDLEARAQACGGRVQFLGFRRDVPEILAASAMLVLPSRWEGMPNVLLEAMAAGLPVVATDVEGVREVLGPQADRQAVRFGDSQGFIERAVRILADEAFAARLREENRSRAAQFSFANMVSAYEQLYLGLLSRGV